jgi:uncharacterized protein (DUF3820 family)
MNTTTKPNAILPFGKYAGRTVSQVAKEHPSYLLFFCTLTKPRADARLCAALAAHLPETLVGAAAEDRARTERREAETQARRQRVRETQAAYWARVAAEIC